MSIKNKSHLEKEYERLLNSIVDIPKGRHLTYTPEMFFQIKAIQSVLGASLSEQKIFEAAVDALFKFMVGVPHKEIVEKIKQRLIPERSFKRLKTCLDGLRRIRKDEYPTMDKISYYDWKSRLENLDLYLRTIEFDPALAGTSVAGFIEPVKDLEAEKALIRHEIRLVAEIVDILQNLGI